MIGAREDLDEFGCDPIASIIGEAPGFRESKGLNGHQVSVREAIGDLEITGTKLVESSDTDGFMQIKYKPRKRLSAYQELMRAGMETDFSPNSLRLPNHRPQTIEKFQLILDECPPGKTVPKDFRDRHGMRKQCVTPLHPKKMAHTITTLPDDMIHYKEPRILTVRENASLQSFPD